MVLPLEVFHLHFDYFFYFAVAERGKIYRPRTLGIKEAPSEAMGLEKAQATCKAQCHSGLLKELSSSQGSDSHLVQLAANGCVSVTKRQNVQLMSLERENTLSEVLSSAMIMYRRLVVHKNQVVNL